MRRVLLIGMLALATLVPAPAGTAAVADRPERVDFNGDVFDDLAVGVAHEDVGDRPDAGLVNLLEGSASGLEGSERVLFQGADLGGGARVGGSAEAGDALGAAVE